MSLDFQRYGCSLLTQRDARKLIINCLNDFLEEVNKNDQLRPFLKVYPFKPENIDMGIINYGAKGEDVFDPYIGTISAYLGKMEYLTHDPNDDCKYKTIIQETYEEAVAILKKEQKHIPE